MISCRTNGVAKTLVEFSSVRTYVWDRSDSSVVAEDRLKAEWSDAMIAASATVIAQSGLHVSASRTRMWNGANTSWMRLGWLPAHWASSVEVRFAPRVAKSGIILLFSAVGGDLSNTSAIGILPAEATSNIEEAVQLVSSLF